MDQNSPYSPTGQPQPNYPPMPPPDVNGQQPQPVAYDQYGRPLYAHPPVHSQPPQHSHQIVHIARPMDPGDIHIPEKIMRRYEESRKKFPHLNLSKGEYVISAVKRHPIGLVQIWLAVVILIVVFGALFGYLFFNQDPSALLAGTLSMDDARAISLMITGVFFVLIVLGGLIATYVYNNNRFYLTNESVIQEIQTSLFSRHAQTVSLANIEDASYKQDNFLQLMLNYGTIRLSTEGDETTYRFSYVTNPKKHIAVLNNAVEAFKNGRAVDITDD